VKGLDCGETFAVRILISRVGYGRSVHRNSVTQTYVCLFQGLGMLIP